MTSPRDSYGAPSPGSSIPGSPLPLRKPTRVTEVTRRPQQDARGRVQGGKARGYEEEIYDTMEELEETDSLFSAPSDPRYDERDEAASTVSRTISSTSALNPSSPDVKIKIFIKALEAYLLSRY